MNFADRGRNKLTVGNISVQSSSADGLLVGSLSNIFSTISLNSLLYGPFTGVYTP